MNQRILGICGLAGAPFLLIDTINNGFDPYQTTSLSGFFCLLYISGWICSLVALKRMDVFETSRFSRILFVVQLVFLALANCWNIYEWIQPHANTRLYFLLDMFWPISNLCMLATGITIAVQGVLKGWRRYVPLAVGLWAPLGIVLWLLFGRPPAMLLTVGIYSALAWSLLAISILTNKAGTNRYSAQRSKHFPKSRLVLHKPAA